MSMRNALNRSPMIVAAVVVLLVAVAVWAVYKSVQKGPVIRTSAYYSADNGQTWFEAEAKEVPPITHEGKPAVRVYLFTCPDGKQFVGYMERFTDQAKAVLDQIKAAKAAKTSVPASKVDMGAVQSAVANGRQVKKPGDNEWINGNGPGGMAIKKVTCPDGQPAASAE